MRSSDVVLCNFGRAAELRIVAADVDDAVDPSKAIKRQGGTRLQDAKQAAA